MKKGDRVEFIDAEMHARCPEFYPPVGTIGTVVFSASAGVRVQWPEGSTSKDDEWVAGVDLLRLVEVD
jgi:hypothetical protein